MIIPTFCLLAFALSIDYSLSLITAQAYWVSLGGNPNLAGLVFGIYDASTFVFAPFLAIYISKGYSYKKMFMTGLVINIIGNAIYALAYLANDRAMIIVGRAISGLGAACLPFIIVHIAEFMSDNEQTRPIGYVKYTAAASRMLGPLIGSLFTIMVNPSDTSGKLFNMYTMAGWIPILIDLIALGFLGIYFPPNSLTGYQPLNSVKAEVVTEPLSTREQISLIARNFWSILCIGFITTLIYWMFMGNAFVIATHFFHVIDDQRQLFHIYITGFMGFIGAFLLFFFGKKRMPKFGVLACSTVVLLASCYLYTIRASAMFYLAVGATTFGYALTIPYINVINNGIGKKIKKDVGSNMVYAIFMLTIFQSAARFVGPAAFMIFTRTYESKDCNFDDQEHYVTSGCTIDNYRKQNVAYISLALLFATVALIFLHNRLKRLSK
jgi:MFS family permease